MPGGVSMTPRTQGSPTSASGTSLNMWALILKPMGETLKEMPLRPRLYCHPTPWVPVLEGGGDGDDRTELGEMPRE